MQNNPDKGAKSSGAVEAEIAILRQELAKLRSAQFEELQFQKFLLDQASDGIVIISPNHKILQANNAFCNMLGYSENEITHLYTWDFVALTTKQEIINDFTGLEDVNTTFESKHRRINGVLLDVEVSVKGMDWKGEKYFFCIVRDISARKLAESNLRESEAKYRLIFEKSPFGIAHFDRQGFLTSCNEQFAAIVGAPIEKMIGTDIKKATFPGFTTMFQTIIDGKPITYEGVYKTVSSGKEINIKIQVVPVFNNKGEVINAIAIMEDRSLWIEKQQLEKKIAVAQESVKFKQNFLANMSHEIRTPLTGILGAADLITRTHLTAQQAELMEILRKSGENLREIINQVLDFSKIEAGKITLMNRTFYFNELIESSIYYFQSVCKNPVVFSTHVDKAIPEKMHADQGKIIQILNNLINNAVKFTPSGEIKLSANMVVNPERNKYSHIKIEISDTGNGINPAQEEYIFQPFAQIDHHDVRQFEGTGLGLTICRQLSNLMGGDTGYKPNNPVGSIFWFTFGFSHAEEEVKESLSSANNSLTEKTKSLNILFAEDKVVNQKVVSLMLTTLGHKVTVAKDGFEVLEKFNQDSFDLILMDIQMPKMDGLTATQELKNSFTTLPPIIGLSANAFEGDREKYMELGLDDYLTKPVKSDDFNRIIKQFFP